MSNRETIQSWSHFSERVTPKGLAGKWLFRGGLRGWGLETSLERAFRDWRLPFEQMPETERRLIREFRRAFTLSRANLTPDEADTVGWLALMQHHGAPTRLLDWTYSPFVAVYFAMEALLGDRNADEAVVWAVSAEPFDTPETLVSNERLLTAMKHFCKHRDGKSFEIVFLRRRQPLKFIFPVNPAKLNQRLIIQLGVFLCPADITVTFEANLVATEHSLGQRLRRYEFVFRRTILQEAIAALYRMNMQPATLFPGLDGYARGLKSRLHFICTSDFMVKTYANSDLRLA